MTNPRAGPVYFGLVFAAGWVLGPIRELILVPHLGRSPGLVLQAPIMLAAMTVSARWVLKRFNVPRKLGTTATVGLVALSLPLAAEALGSLAVRRASPGEYIATFGTVAGLISLMLFLLFGAMPAIVGRWRGDPASGRRK